MVVCPQGRGRGGSKTPGMLPCGEGGRVARPQERVVGPRGSAYLSLSLINLSVCDSIGLALNLCLIHDKY